MTAFTQPILGTRICFLKSVRLAVIGWLACHVCCGIGKLCTLFEEVLVRPDQVFERLLQNLPAAIQNYGADWIVMELPDVGQMPEWVDNNIDVYPSMHFMAIPIDSSRVKLKWLESCEEEFTNLTSPDLIHILES